MKLKLTNMAKNITKKIIYSIVLMSFYGYSQPYSEHKVGQSFIKQFAKKSTYSEQDLINIFSKVKQDENILRKISRPAEKTTPWFKYKKIFSGAKRLENGIKFYNANKQILDEAYAKYGVSPSVIVAIIGVETRYGKVMGKDKVLTALSTIAFDYPKRAKFFTAQLEAFLKIAKKENINPFIPVGSYAGAMGMTQFMPSSYTDYAVDYENDGKIDLWKNPKDAIFSVANYLNKHGWKKDEFIVDEALTLDYQGNFNHKPFTVLATLKEQGVFPANLLVLDDVTVGILELDGETGKKHFLTFNNFAVITTYNTSPMYALAVANLANNIKTKANN